MKFNLECDIINYIFVPFFIFVKICKYLLYKIFLLSISREGLINVPQLRINIGCIRVRFKEVVRVDKLIQ